MRIPSRIIGGVLIVALLSELTGCGTILYPNRRGQIQGRIDPAVVIMDGIGLLFFVLPGVIAFGVDFMTGAIYYRGGRYGQITPEKLNEAIGANGQVDTHKLQAIVQSQLGLNVPLNDPRMIEHKGNVEQLAMYGFKPSA